MTLLLSPAKNGGITDLPDPQPLDLRHPAPGRTSRYVLAFGDVVGRGAFGGSWVFVFFGGGEAGDAGVSGVSSCQ